MTSLGPPRFQLTIGHLLVVILVSALSIAPVVLALRSPDEKYMVAAVAFDVILLPVIVALFVLRLMPAGQRRNWVIAGLCAAPILLLISIGLIANTYIWVVMYVLRPIKMIWLAISQGAGLSLLESPTPLLHLLMAVTLFNLIRSGWNYRCPLCGCRRFQAEFRRDLIKRMVVTTGAHLCRRCGTKLRTNRGWFGRWTIERAEIGDPIPPPTGDEDQA